MKKIFLLLDYLNRFGSKHDDFPYRSGMEIEKLVKYFARHNYLASALPFSEVDFSKNRFVNQIVLYTSQEDPDYYYKDFIEDIVFGLELSGAIVVPGYKYLRANNNKVFMEILRKGSKIPELCNIKSSVFGTKKEALALVEDFNFPVIVKAAAGASGRNVELVHNEKELSKVINRLSASSNPKEEFREIVRSYRYIGYKKQSKHRKKFIIQNFIPNLENDWKVYVFGHKIFVFYRPVLKKRGFRASGGGYDNYYYGKRANVPPGLFDLSYKIFKSLETPFVSLDLAFDGKQFYLLEFQCLYFGTAGILKKYSNEYFIKKEDEWLAQPNDGDIEKVYVDSVIEFITIK